MKYRLTEDWLEYKKGDSITFEEFSEILEYSNPLVNGLLFRLSLKTGILEEVRDPIRNILDDEFVESRKQMDENFAKVYPREVKEEEWPTMGDRYFIVDADGTPISFMWTGNPVDNKYKDLGNCFRTRKDALEASEKIKTLLLSLKK